MSLPGFTAEASLYESGRSYTTTGRLAGADDLTRSDVRMQARINTIGNGPKRWQLPDWFSCTTTSIGFETCHSCFNTSGHGRRCVCYDCDEGSGECTEGYDCTGTYSRPRPGTGNTGVGGVGGVGRF